LAFRYYHIFKERLPFAAFWNKINATHAYTFRKCSGLGNSIRVERKIVDFMGLTTGEQFVLR